jgi:SAM-dependent methyltransferase
MLAPLRPASPQAKACKICGADAALYGVIDFNRSCEEARGRYLPLSGIAVYYRRCGACGLLFTDCFDDWSDADFQRHIYNGDYAVIDPDYAERRPTSNAALLAQLFGNDKGRLRVLDYGGGSGKVASLLRGNGFLATETYDPFTPEFARLPDGKFELVTCFETLEHLPDPKRGAAAIASRLAEPGLVLFSTLVQPADFDKQKMNWWYIGPRNGHISLFSRQALTALWQQHGFAIGSFNDDLHVAFRTMPDFASHLLRRG